ncbi:MAG: hypothetical protein ACJASF_001552 [Vicingaceae bacterium]|jgi:hypothetical protein
MKIRRLLVIWSALLFMSSLMVSVTSCGGSKSASKSKVKSGSGMGNQNHKNKHVWGK